METLLIFLAIAAIQFIAAYSKKKKEEARKAARKNAPVRPNYEQQDYEQPETEWQRDDRVPQESSPVPDPFKEIREALGLPPAETAQHSESRARETYEREIPTAEEKHVSESANAELSTKDYSLQTQFSSITDRNYSDRHTNAQTELQPNDAVQAVQPPQRISPRLSRVIDISKPEQGILWTAILSEPRYKKKWAMK